MLNDLEQMPRATLCWPEEMFMRFCQAYPRETDERLMATFEIPVTALRHLVLIFGLKKMKATDPASDTARMIAEYWDCCTLPQIAVKCGCSISTVKRVAASLGLRCPKDKRRERITTGINERHRSENRRILFGLEQKTKRKLVKNDARNALRKKLRAAGYIVSRGSNTIFIPDGLKRLVRREQNACKLGFHFFIENDSRADGQFSNS